LTFPNSHYRGVNSFADDQKSLTFACLQESGLFFVYSTRTTKTAVE
jgi:hypothetical protein